MSTHHLIPPRRASDNEQQPENPPLFRITPELIKDLQRGFTFPRFLKTPAGFLLLLALLIDTLAFIIILTTSESNVGSFPTYLQIAGFICGALAVIDLLLDLKKAFAKLQNFVL